MKRYGVNVTLIYQAKQFSFIYKNMWINQTVLNLLEVKTMANTALQLLC